MLNPLNIISKFIKSGNQKELDRIQKIVKEINLKESKVSKFEDNEFPLRTNEFISRLQEGEKLNDILPEAFALVREASKRINNERHFDVQLIGGIALHENKIAEMKTGEGKTLTIVLAAYLNALEKKGVHIVTVNDYLAKRDSINMGKIYNFLGLSCGYINSNQSDEERKENYNKDIIKQFSKNEKDVLLNEITKSNSIEKSKEIVNYHYEKALYSLFSIPESNYRKALESIITISRNRI